MANEVEITVTSKDKTNFDDAGRSADRYSGKLGTLGEKADDAEMRTLGLKDTVDGVATIMRGPGEQGIAAYLQGWADLASGLANFVLPTLAAATRAVVANGVATIKNTAATVASRAAMIAGAVAVGVMTAAQWALNAALTANPIGIVVVAVAALIAILVLAYKRSETFRNVVNGAFRAVVSSARNVREAAVAAFKILIERGAAVIDFFRKLPGRLADSIKGLGKALVDRFSGAIKRVLEFLGIKSPSKVFQDIGTNMVAGLAKGIAGKMKAIPDLFGKLSGMAGNAFSFLLGGGPPVGPTSFGSNRALVKRLAEAIYGWTGGQWIALANLITGESGFNNLAQNRTSTAFGMFQFLDSTWSGVGARKTADPYAQTVAGLRYIAGSYGTPAAAYGAWLGRSPHWYHRGGPITEDIMGVGRSGRTYGFQSGETVVARGAEQTVVFQLAPGGGALDQMFFTWLRKAVRTGQLSF